MQPYSVAIQGLKICTGLAFCLYVLGILHFFRMGAEITQPLATDTKIDIAIVFYGDEESRALRLAAAMERYEDGQVLAIGFVGGCRPAQKLFGSLNLADTALKLGVPKGDIFVGHGSYDSLSNLKSLEQLLLQNEWQNIAYISDPLHLRRLADIALKNSMDKRLSKPHFIATGYGDTFLDRFKRVNSELGISILKFFLTDKTYDEFVRNLRLGQTANTGYAMCKITPNSPMK